jgi:acyl-CoA synthetase (AMP-forming)/AMP-acid ligase II
MNAAQPFLEKLEALSERTAIVEPGGRSVTYAGLSRRVAGLCRLLENRGFTPGDRVVLQIPNGIELAVSAIAVLLKGGVPVLIEPGLGDEVYRSRVRVSEPGWLLVHPLVLWVNRVPGTSSLLRRMEMDVPPVPAREKGMNRIVISPRMMDRLAERVSDGERITCAERRPDDDGILIFTGGTTSLPKGVRLGHRALGDYITNISSLLRELSLERFLADTPQQVLYALRLGKTAFISRGRKQKRARTVLERVRRGQIDAYFGSPYVWMEMMSRAGATGTRLPRTLKTVLLGGAPVTADFLALLLDWVHPETAVFVLYGMTEVGPVCAVRARDKLAYRGKGDLVGAPLGNVSLEIQDAGAGGGPGEVVVHSSSLYTGYLEQPARPEGEGLHTGDLGTIVDVNGREMLSLMGREKDMIIRSSVNIYPLSFEPSIRALRGPDGKPLLRECALVGLWNPERQDEDVVLCLQPARGVRLDMVHLKKQVEKICGTDAKPDHFLVQDPIPVTGRQNKVDKRALQRRCARELGYPDRGRTGGGEAS